MRETEKFLEVTPIFRGMLLESQTLVPLGTEIVVAPFTERFFAELAKVQYQNLPMSIFCQKHIVIQQVASGRVMDIFLMAM